MYPLYNRRAVFRTNTHNKIAVINVISAAGIKKLLGGAVLLMIVWRRTSGSYMKP